ncbi:prephenate dehydrogenase [Peribacillus asahii]|uniref:Prephenate dehydrogenase n=1 Tax=Peribacillus asahii TaxID=228899 RepID=A0A3Q9RQ35_9BACI|nr:prephenate dehydrogenase [Peribacillus asahii]AZV44133.1 prephenate dehydrogenase [Peribacillus asahii]USK83852.1 prephenate dehydrogenase [Peribacillus asahii]
MNGKVFIIGLGLIGGSLAMAIRQAHESVHIVGYDVNENNIQLAKLLGIVDDSVDSIAEGVLEADLILLAVPVDQTEKIVIQLADMKLKDDVIVTDAGSTKSTVVEAAKHLMNRGITFIGGHPMAGSHKSGAGAAKPHLFENAFYLLTPSDDHHTKEINQLKEWLKGTRANFLVVSPHTHDWLTGVISHFPHIVAAGLVKQAQTYSEENELVARLAAGGFRDITRIASSSPEMWRDILLHNRDVLLDLMDDWIMEMAHIKELVANRDSGEIYRFFAEAKVFRDDMPVHAKGAIPAYYDLYVDIPDTPGSLAEITGLLAQKGISITNIRIIETREEIYGVLVISFQNEEDRLKAAEAIGNYTTYETILA